MQARSLVLLAAAAVAVAGCVVSGLAPQPVVSGSQMQAAKRTAVRPETLVDKQRLRSNLAILSGVSALPGGKLINERGGVEGRELTRQFLIASMEAMGLTVERRPYRKNGENIVATLKATVPSNEYILIGGHMDSVRNRGADDDGSGSAATLEAARVLSQMPERKVNILFGWFDEEELGLVGSKHLAREMRRQGLNLTSVHCLDMVGYDNDGDSAVEIARPEGDLWDYYQMVNKTHGLNLPLYRVNTGRSDHVSFANEGFKSVLLCEEFNHGDSTPFYHRATDTIETINFDFLANVTRLVTATVSDLAMKVPAPPGTRFVPHERFPGKDLHCHP